MWNVFEVNSEGIWITSMILSCVFIVNFQQISHIHLVFPSVTLSK